MLEKVYGLSDYITINISSPNTPGLRNLQGKEELDRLLSAIMAKRAELPGKKIPILLKISPDTNTHERADIAEISLKHNKKTREKFNSFLLLKHLYKLQ